MILDCTLRDGGYYVNWDFDESTVIKYLSAVAIAKIDIIELGFRFLQTNHFMGAFAYTTDEYLKTITLPENVTIAVMINATEIINRKESSAREAVNLLFDKKNKSQVSIVRVAVHAKDIDHSYEIVHELKSLGYRVFVNLMQIDSMENDDITKISSLIDSWKMVEVLYFADSFGSMDTDRVKEVINAISKSWKGSIGIHAHDNKGLALQNTLVAEKYGVEYLDSTLYGMGRGAGNAKTEYLLVEMTRLNKNDYVPDALFPLVLQEFGELKKIYGWGENVYYFLSAVYGIHPTYIQEMLSGELYDTEQILSAINFLRESKVSLFSIEKMLMALVGIEGNGSGNWTATGWAKGKDVLILASGPEMNKHLNAIKQYIKTKKPVVLCLNINELISKEMVTAYVACHETRILIESDRYDKLDAPIILPLDRVPESIKYLLAGIEIFDYGLSIKSNAFEINSNGTALSNSYQFFMQFL